MLVCGGFPVVALLAFGFTFWLLYVFCLLCTLLRVVLVVAAGVLVPRQLFGVCNFSFGFGFVIWFVIVVCYLVCWLCFDVFVLLLGYGIML